MPVLRFPILLAAVATLLAFSLTKTRADDTPIHSIDVGPAIAVPDNDGDTWCPA